MNKEFNLFIYSNDPNFCSALALECNSYGFELTFFELKDFKKNFQINNKVFSVVIIDLSGHGLNFKLKKCEEIRLVVNYPIFGVVDKMSKELQNKSKDYGCDLIFTKRTLLKSLKKVVVHIIDK